MNDKNFLRGKSIFLSASFPQEDRDKKYFEGTYPLEITNAVVAVTKAIFNQKGRIIFGGHPTISPLILSIGTDFLTFFKNSDLPLVYIYQSRYFEHEVSEYTLELVDKKIGEIRWVESVNDDREDSLHLMRKRMLEETSPVAGIFIGGMKGIIDEFNLFTEILPEIPAYPLGATGGATRQLFEQKFISKEKWNFNWSYNEINLYEKLQKNNTYPSLVNDIFLDLKLKLNNESNLISIPVAILFTHDNRIKNDISRFYKLIKLPEKENMVKIYYNEMEWKSEAKKKILQKEKLMIQEADVIVSVVSPRPGEKSHILVQSEIRRAMHAHKPIIEIFERGIENYRIEPSVDEKYGKKILIYLQPKETILDGVKRGMKELRKKKLTKFDENIPLIIYAYI